MTLKIEELGYLVDATDAELNAVKGGYVRSATDSSIFDPMQYLYDKLVANAQLEGYDPSSTASIAYNYFLQATRN